MQERGVEGGREGKGDYYTYRIMDRGLKDSGGSISLHTLSQEMNLGSLDSSLQGLSNAVLGCSC